MSWTDWLSPQLFAIGGLGVVSAVVFIAGSASEWRLRWRILGYAACGLGFLVVFFGMMAFGAPAHAAVAGGGGGMPYSTGLNTFKTSVTGEVAGIICLIGVIAGCAAYLYQGVLDPLLMKIVQVVIAICIIGGAATFITSMGVTGAVVIAHTYPPPIFNTDTTMMIVAIGLFSAVAAAWLQPRVVAFGMGAR